MWNGVYDGHLVPEDADLSRKTLGLALLILVVLLVAWFLGLNLFRAGPNGAPGGPINAAGPGTAVVNRHPATEVPAGTAPPGEALPTPVAEAGTRKPFLRVLTNVPGATVTVQFVFGGGEPEPNPESKVADAAGVAGFDPPRDPSRVLSTTVQARAGGKGIRPIRLGGHEPQELRLDLLPLAVRGQVLGGDGRPLAGAWVYYGVPQWTDDSGRFEIFARFLDDPARDPLILKIQHPQYLERTVEVREPTEDLVVRLERGLEVWGAVRFPNGKPVPGVEVVGMGVPWNVAGRTADDGTFVLSGLPSGPVRVRCILTGEERGVQAGATGVDFAMDSHVVRLHFLDEAGRPFREAEAHVSVLGEGSEIPTGACEIGGGREGLSDVSVLPGSRIVVTPEMRGWQRRPVEFAPTGEPGLHDLSVVFHPAVSDGVIEFHASDTEGRSLRRIYVILVGRPGDLLQEQEIPLDALGHGRMEGVWPGDQVVTVAASKQLPHGETYDIPLTRTVRVESGESVVFPCPIRTGGRVRVTVRGPDGAPVAPQEIRMREEGGNGTVAWFMGTRNGRWEAVFYCAGPALSNPPVPPGRYVVEIVPSEGAAPIVRRVAVASGETTSLEVSSSE